MVRTIRAKFSWGAYGATRLESPASRFTIAFFGRGGSRIAVGHEVADAHIIDEFDPGKHPAFYLAEDLTLIRNSENGGGRVNASNLAGSRHVDGLAPTPLRGALA